MRTATTMALLVLLTATGAFVPAATAGNAYQCDDLLDPTDEPYPFCCPPEWDPPLRCVPRSPLGGG